MSHIAHGGLRVAHCASDQSKGLDAERGVLFNAPDGVAVWAGSQC